MEQKIPQNIDAEQAVLGSVFFEQSSLKAIVDKLADEDFYSPVHRVIFQTMKELFQEHVAIDYTTLKDRLESKNLLAKAGGVEYVVGLVEAVPSSANLINYINIVKDKAVLRKIQDACRAIVEDSYAVENAPEFIDDVAGVFGAFGPSDAALLDVVFGKAKVTGKLPFDVPSDMPSVMAQAADVPFDMVDPMFRFGFGLTYTR